MRYSKYRAIPTFIDGIRFHSKKEASRYKELLLLQKAGEIKHLELQKRYSLLVAGEKIGVYIADFVYLEKGKDDFTVEDCKAPKSKKYMGSTPLYRWKKKHFEAQYGTKILET